MNYSEEELVRILAKQAKRYSSNESSSISYHTARKLMSSILFCMQEMQVQHTVIEGLEEEKNEIFNKNVNLSAEEAFELGKARKKNKIRKAKNLYERIYGFFESYENICYQDTFIEGMKAFFLYYDLEFDAINHILTLDYPLLVEVRDLKGIDLIYEYLLRTYLEQLFLAEFEKKEISKIMYTYHKEYKDLVINIAKIVLRNALANILVGSSVSSLSVSKENSMKVKKLCKSKSVQEIESMLHMALHQLIKEKGLEIPGLITYLEKVIPDIAYEIKNGITNDCLDNILIEDRKEETRKDSIYIEGKTMEDENLRKLVEKMRDSNLEEKIELIKKKVKSLTDLKEILKECIYLEEYSYVFCLLSEVEKDILINEIKEKLEFSEELEEWEKFLIQR